MTEGINKHVFTISTFLVFVFPMIVISVLYILIGLQLRRSKVVKRGNACGSSVRIKVKSKKQKNYTFSFIFYIIIFSFYIYTYRYEILKQTMFWYVL